MNPKTARQKTQNPTKTTIEWAPYAGKPQDAAFHSQAFVVGYGGAGGGGKSDCLLGTAASNHQKADIFRREYPQLDDLIDRSHEILGSVADYNGSTRVWSGSWKAQGGQLKRRKIRFAAVQRFDDLLKKWRGRTRDFLGIDEATEWPELMIRFLMGWVRSSDPEQRCRVVLTFNPPTSAEGMWVISFFAPWLDPKHPNPARAGEIRWFARLGDKDVEVETGDPIEHEGQTIYPQSRTFIPALLKDNPVLAATTYDQTLSSLPEPLRSQLRNGDFAAGVADDAWQCIPTRWVELAMERGRKTPKPRDAQGLSIPLSCLGVDPSRGGAAAFAIAPRYDNWFAPVITHKGITTSDGPKGAALVVEEWGLGATIHIDITGIGTSVYDSLVERAEKMLEETSGKMEMIVSAINSASPSKMRDRSGKYRLVNVRAAMYWTLREALDPDHGANLCLPDDSELKADLCAPRYKITTEGIMIEPKYPQPGQSPQNSVSGRLGRSPDKGDAVVLAHWLRGVSYFAV